MAFPDAIRQHLEQDYHLRRQPFCFRIDTDARLQDAWGDGTPYGLSGLQTGDHMFDHAPYLIGQLTETAVRLPFVSSGRHALEVHIIPAGEDFFVVVMDVSAEHDFRQARQQVANELRLMHAAREKLIEQQDALIGELIETKAELDLRRREAERANERRSDFFAMMSHEFRTPLSSIVNYATLAQDDSAGADVVKKCSESISRAAQHMTRLVDTVLDEARLETGRLVLTEAAFHLPDLLADLSNIIAPLAAEKQLSFSVQLVDDVPTTLWADDACLRQILINLLGNAVKFTDAGFVQLRIDWQDDVLSAEVRDSGPGIPHEDQERVFGAFERATRDDEKTTPGSGLGLKITLELARLMGGSIALSSEPGEGCTVNVRVPARLAADKVDTDALPEPDVTKHAAQPATILICDDDEDLLDLTEYYLLRAGYGLLVANDGSEAVDKAMSLKPDLVILDINTPGMPGTQAASELKRRGFSSPIIALTASDTRKLDDTVFYASLRKPIQMPRLLSAIHRFLSESDHPAQSADEA
ncbi:MAG: ATP-binding protein [Pseudomonadota bacterium]